MTKTTQKGSYPEPKRLSFPADEAKNKWLPMLLDAYFIADKGLYQGIRRRLNQGHKLACAKGCSSCCKTNTTIPVYPLELVGLYWYAIEKIHAEQREKLKTQLRNFTKGNPCPFLIEGICSAYLMRPLACRHFNVFNKPCDEGEDAYYTRRHDVLTPIEKYKNKALSTMLPFHGIKERAKRREAIKTGFIHGFAETLQELEWSKLAKRMGTKRTSRD